MRASSKALNPHSYADSFSGSGCRYATMKGATRSTSPITSEIPIKIARGRYSCSSAFIFTSLHPRREPQRVHNRFPRPGGPAPPTRLGKSWIRSTAGDKTRLSAAHHRWQVDVDVAAALDAHIAMVPGVRMGVAINRASCGDLRRRREPIAIKAPHPGRVRSLESALTDRQPHPFLPVGAGQDGEEGPACGLHSAPNLQAGSGKNDAFPSRWRLYKGPTTPPRFGGPSLPSGPRPRQRRTCP